MISETKFRRRHLAMTYAVNPALYGKLPYDPVADFEPITRFGTSTFVVLLRANSSVKSLAELTALLNAEPGKHNFGEGFLPARAASELYRHPAGVEVGHVDCKSNLQTFPDLLNRQPTPLVIDTVNGKLQIDGGAMRGLSVTLPQREPRLAHVLRVPEAGLADFLIWSGPISTHPRACRRNWWRGSISISSPRASIHRFRCTWIRWDPRPPRLHRKNLLPSRGPRPSVGAASSVAARSGWSRRTSCKDHFA